MVIEPKQESRGCRRGRVTAAFRTGRLLVAATVLFTAMAAAGDTRANSVTYSELVQQYVIAAALKSTVPPELALAVARVGGTRWSHVEDGRETVGVMGIRPSLARAEFGVGPYQLRERSANAGLGVALLERLHRRHEGRWDLALSHYRGGPLGRCGNEAVVHLHTVDYVADVMKWWRQHQDDESVSSTIQRVRENGFQAERFTANTNTFTLPSSVEVIHDYGRPLPSGAREVSSGGSWIAVADGAARFRSDLRRPYRSVGYSRFF